MAQGAQVVDLIALHPLGDPDQIGAVGEIPIVQHQPGRLSHVLGFVGILVEMINAAGVVCEACRMH